MRMNLSLLKYTMLVRVKTAKKLAVALGCDFHRILVA